MLVTDLLMARRELGARAWIVAASEADQHLTAAGVSIGGELPIIGSKRPSEKDCLTWECENFEIADQYIDAQKSFVLLSTLQGSSHVNLVELLHAASYRVGLVYFYSEAAQNKDPVSSLSRHQDPNDSGSVLDNLRKASRLADEFLLFNVNKNHYELIGHVVNGLPKETHPLPPLILEVGLPGLLDSEHLRQRAVLARASVLARADSISREMPKESATNDENLSKPNSAPDRISELTPLGRHKSPLPEVPESVREFIARERPAITVTQEQIHLALVELPLAQEKIQDWCDRQDRIAALNRTPAPSC